MIKRKNRKVQKVYIHPGMHKTATTSIQDTLFNNSEKLCEYRDGYLYPKEWVRNHSIPVSSMFMDYPETYHINIRKGFDEEKIEKYNLTSTKTIIKELLRTKCKTVIISGEGISRLQQHEIEKFKKFLENLLPNADFEIIIFVRNPVSYIGSIAQQLTKSGRYFSIDNFYQKPRMLYRNVINKFYDLFDNVKIYTFEEACTHKNGPVGYFLEKLEIGADLINELNFERENSSISYKAFEICEYINKKHPLIIDNKVNANRNDNDLLHIQKIESQKFKLTRSQSEKVRAACEEDIIWLKEQTGIDYNSSSTYEYLDENIFYDELYYDQVKYAIDNSVEFIRNEIYLFLVEKDKEIDEEHGNKIFKKLIAYYKDTYALNKK